MAKFSITPREYIQNAFPPQIAILCSEDADNICLKNNLRFVELLQPFSKPSSEARICDPSGNNITIKNFKVYFEDMNRRPSQPTLGKKILNDAVANCPWDTEDIKNIKGYGNCINSTVEFNERAPWFELWRDLFLQIQYPSDHEFTKHYIACIIVVSAGSENAMDQLNRLSQYQHQQQHQNPGRFPKWFSPNILKHYILLHDIEQVTNESADKIFDQMTSAYGPINCHLLHINSRSSCHTDSQMSDPWKIYLKHRGMIDGMASNNSNSEASSGSVTPKDDVAGLPSRVSEGDSSESSDIIHPLSPVSSIPDEKNGVIDNPPPPADVPLMINSKSLSPDVISGNHHGGCLTSSDIDRIKIFVDEFCLRTLIPHVERQIRYLNDVVTNRSRSKSLLSATRRWLGGSKVPSGANNSVIYSQEATELQTRRLGDLCFMFGLYEMAYNAYYTAKNDFKSDQAWLYFSGAQEMAALSSFMQGSSDFPKRYLEGSLHSYLNVCKVYNFAIRLTLLSSEIFKHYEEFGEAAMMFIKMTSEESDLLSALMLEQAAHCFIRSKRPLLRKYAFHMTLAGHRFSKAGQRAHSYRAYKQAFQVYLDRGWILAEDHIHYSMGKQAFHLKQISDSYQATARLINQSTNDRTSSHQLANQQIAYMREFLNILDRYLKDECQQEEIPFLPVPLLDSQKTKVILGTNQHAPQDANWQPATNVSFLDDDSLDKRWFAMEKELLKVIQGPQMIFRPNLHLLTNDTPNTLSPFVPQNELISIRIVLKNPMLISLTITNVSPLIKFFNDSGEEVDNSCVKIESLTGFNIPPESEEVVKFSIWPQCVGRLLVTGIKYTLGLTSELITSSVEELRKVNVDGKLEFSINGPRLNTSMAEKMSVTYAKDERLNILVIPPLPRLSVLLNDPPGVMSCGEVKDIKIVLTNVGPVPLKNLYLSTSNPKHILFSNDQDAATIDSFKFKLIEDCQDSRLKNRIQRIDLPEGVLNPGDKLSGHLWLHAPVSPDAFDVELLFYYEPKDYFLKNKYRLVRHITSIFLCPSVGLTVQSFRSLNLLTKPKENYHHLHSTNIVFHIKNKCEIGNIEIIGVSANSHSWRIIPHNKHELQSISVNQSCQLCIRCVHVHNQKNKLVFSYIPLSNQNLPECWWRFTLRERAKITDLISESSGHPTNRETLGKTGDLKDENTVLDMTVTIVWKGMRGNETIIGQHSVYLDRLGERQSAPSIRNVDLAEEDFKPPVRIISDDETRPAKDSVVLPLNDQQYLVKVALKYTSEICHNFSTAPLCRIVFVVSLYNTCPQELTAMLNFSSKLSMGDVKQTQMFSPRACTNLLTVGTSVRKMTLHPWQLKEVESQCVVTRPGTYCLGAFTLKVRRTPHDEWTNQICEFQSCVVVTSDSQQMFMKKHMNSELSSIHTLSYSS